MECNFIDLELHIRTTDRLQLAACLPLLGGLFAELCRCVDCPNPGRDCCSCSRSAACDWYAVFGQALSADPDALKRHQKPPLPFVFSFPLLKELPASPGILACGLVVIGSAISRLGLLLEGFSRLLSSGSCREEAQIVQLFSRDYQGTAIPLAYGDHPDTPENLVILSLDGVLQSRAWSSTELVIVLHSPLKLRADGHQVRQFEFGLFARSLLRRVSSLVYYYGARESGADFSSLSRQSDAISCTRSDFFFDAAPAGVKKLSGISGQGRFSGNFSELMPFLVAGTYVHAGKSAAFGMGRFSLGSAAADAR